VAGSCEHCNKPSGSIKGGKCIDYISMFLLAPQDRLCSMGIHTITSINVLVEKDVYAEVIQTVEV
jgi:hypothetical protein